MRQTKLKFQPRPKSQKRLAADYDRRNLEMAREFIENLVLCGGPDSFGMRWARMVIERLGEQPA